jgi:Putative phage tail protein
MQTIYEVKEQAVTDTPLLVFDCVLADGRAEHWSTHAVTVGGVAYDARVMSHNVFELQGASDQGIDGIPKISLALGNADSHFSEIERQTGWKGARLTASFLFYDLRNDAAATDAMVLFQGICNAPDEIREATFRITATNRMNLQRLLLPQVRIQRRCGWEFPATDAQRTEAIDGGANGKYSRFYRCGYSAGVAGGQGALNGGSPYTSCGFTRSDCTARGMFANFGGLEFVPPAIQVRTSGDKDYHTSAVSADAARYNDFVPVVYGTAWYNPPVVFARNDGNLTRMEVLLGIGEMQGVLKVLVNDVEIPAGVNGVNMTGTGWYNVPTLGTRPGAVDPNFTDGDPYGSMAYASVVVPNRLNNGTTLPKVAVLVQGLKLPVYGTDGALVAEQFSSNPAWVVLDMLRRMGWGTDEIDVASFAAAAALCDEEIPALDLYGNAITLPRFACNLVLQKRKAAGDVVRGVRNAARLMLTYGSSGKIGLRMENSVAQESPTKPAWSNAMEVLDGGWPSYEFGDGSTGVSGILRNANGEPSVRLTSRSTANTPNRWTVEFQDSLNEYQQDSFSLVDPDDVARCGQEVAAPLPALGIANFDQASRILKLNLDKSVRGNTYIEFDTSVKCLGIRPGDLITVTYLKEGFERQPFRVQKMAPGTNHRITKITAQIHDDSWYADSNGQAGSASGGRRQGNAGNGVPRPLLGDVLDGNGDVQYGVQESATTAADGTVQTSVQVSFVAPSTVAVNGPQIPLVSLAATVGTGGTLAGGQVLYYAVSGVDASGNESGLSFLVRAVTVSDGASVTLGGLSFSPGTTGFRVYRGVSPAQLYRIADESAVAATFTDGGMSKQLVAPADPNYDHANFYWRLELQGETAAMIHSTTTVGNDSLQMTANRYRNMIARITRGTGAGEERVIAANDATTLTVAPAWTVTPDATSHFAVTEAGWQFGALSATSPVQFAIPNRAGETVEIMGRAANASDVECAAELSIVTRWQIGGSGGADDDVPAMPFFGLGAGAKPGTVELSGVSFNDLTNTHTIVAATLTLHYWDELSGRPSLVLASAVAAGDATVSLATPGSAVAGDLVQIEGEVLRVDAVLNVGLTYQVTRGMHGSAASAHAAGSGVYRLQNRTVIAPFAEGFFGSPYSGSWSFAIVLPDARIASAELFVTNARGNSPARAIVLTSTVDQGLRTLSGGQYSIEVEGFLAVDAVAAPAVVVEASHAVRDVFAVLGTAADADVVLRMNVDGTQYCELTVAAGQTTSAAVSGLGLGPLVAGSKLTLSVVAVGSVYPGSDLTVLVRL